MKIGILQADTVLDQFSPIFGQYPSMIQQVMLTAAGDGQYGTIKFFTYDVEQQEYPTDIAECDGYIITGSKKSVYDDEPWIHQLRDFVVRLDSAKMPTVGICFGHQMIALALGGKACAADVGWRVGVHEVSLLKANMQAAASYLEPAVASFSLLYSHKDQVTELPPGSTLLAGSSQCPNAMFQVGQHMLAVQGHPEFVKDYSRSLMTYRRDMIGEKLYADGMQSLAEPTDELLLVSWFIAFLQHAAALRS